MSRPNDLSAFWLPFTPNRNFKREPRILTRAEGMYFYDESGRALLDTCSGLWCVNAGHGRRQIVEAIRKAAGELDFAPTFQFAHPSAFMLAERIAALAPEDLDHVFFVNSGSEAADTALKIARAYALKIGQGSRFRLIGRERAYHGVNFGGISVRTIICRCPTTRQRWRIRAANRRAARVLPTRWKISWRCTGPKRSPP
jgi:beta-alanine--pyruvate transaminase